MSTRSYTRGRFVWRELVTPDAGAAKRFYSELLGWRIRPVPMPAGTYEMIHAADVPVGGILELAAERGVPPHWNAYVSVADVDGAATRVTQGGGKIVLGPRNIPGLGRFASALDPQGGAFTLFDDDLGDRPPSRPSPGEFCWEQLAAENLPALEGFYATVLGWAHVPTPDRTDIHVFANGDASAPENLVASAMAAPAGVHTHWLSHVTVDELDGARARTVRLGGTVVAERINVPGFGAFAIVRDPQGAELCLFAPTSAG